MSEERMIIEQAIQGDPNAFEQLVLTHQKAVYNLALRMVGNPEDAQDLDQEAFLKAWRGLKFFQFESSFSTWIYRLTSNTCIDFLRRQKKQKLVSTTVLNDDDQAEELLLPDPDPLPEEQAILNEQRQSVVQAMNELEVEYREILTLRVVQGLSYTEIAEILDLKEGTVKSRLARAREKMRRQLLYAGNKLGLNSSSKCRKEEDDSCNANKR